MLKYLVVLRYILQLLGFVAKEINDAEQQKVGQDQQQLRQNRVDLDAIHKANQAATAAVDKFRDIWVQ
jgi:hypothetical protein